MCILPRFLKSKREITNIHHRRSLLTADPESVRGRPCRVSHGPRASGRPPLPLLCLLPTLPAPACYATFEHRAPGLRSDPFHPPSHV